MSTEINATMAVGRWGGAGLPEDYESFGIQRFAPYSNADNKECFYGLPLENLEVFDAGTNWLLDVQDLGYAYHNATGYHAILAGVADVF